MKEVLERLQDLQKDAFDNGISMSTICYMDKEGNEVKVELRYTSSTFGAQDQRYFHTTFSSDDLANITEQKLDLINVILKNAKYSQKLINDITLTEEQNG